MDIWGGGGCDGGVSRYWTSLRHRSRNFLDLSRYCCLSGVVSRNELRTSWDARWNRSAWRPCATGEGIDGRLADVDGALSGCRGALGSLPFFLRSCLRALSSIRTCRSSCSLILFAWRDSPSCFAILAFISARSMSQAFRARSWLCHSIWRKRITPCLRASARPRWQRDSTYPATCIRHPEAHAARWIARHSQHC